jgi:hypothetical protein
MQVDLQHGVGVDYHGRAVAAADGPGAGTYLRKDIRFQSS